MIPPQQEAPSLSLSDALLRPAETLSISEVSDATEIKSLSNCVFSKIKIIFKDEKMEVIFEGKKIIFWRRKSS